MAYKLDFTTTTDKLGTFYFMDFMGMKAQSVWTSICLCCLCHGLYCVLRETLCGFSVGVYLRHRGCLLRKNNHPWTSDKARNEGS